VQSLRQLLSYVVAHNQFYRARFERAGIGVNDINSLEDLRRIPVLTKAEIRFQERSLLSDGVNTAGMVHAKTGGSTGKPIELFLTEAVSQLRAAAGRRHRQWSGWRVGEPSANIWGNPIFPQGLKQRLREWMLIPSITLDTMSISPESIRAFAVEWARVRPTLIFGHAHSIFVLATMVEQLDLREVRPNAIIASSMMLLPHERAVIERIFGVKVTDLYGCEEVGLIASECECHEGLHINAEQVIVEILREDGTPAGPGDTGLVVVTDLLNTAMPFIRYRMEDMAEVAAGACSCGRGLPMLRRVVGRTADFLIRADRSRVAGISLIENSLTRIPGIEQMQIVQDELLRIELRIVPGAGFSKDQEYELQRYFMETFPTASIEVSAVKAISQLPNGKYQFSICRVSD
jgi:phenylacetate-CoA ligase